MARDKRLFVCDACGFQSVKWLGRCPECNTWDSMSEVQNTVKKKTEGVGFISGEEICSLGEIKPGQEEERYVTGMEEFDRVLGGGIVPGSLVLLGGEPGIGKSTLLIQVLSLLADKGLKVLYASGEESASQIGMRAQRLGVSKDVLLLCNPQIEVILKHVLEERPHILAVDSMQTLYCQEVSSLPGSMGQVKAASSALMNLAKGIVMPVLMVGHVTKEGAIAGPRALEHLVDTVLYFEGERTQGFRILRTVKNRFGPTHEIGIFEMKDRGLSQVPNPSNLFLQHRNQRVAGSAIFPCIEGTRPLMVEIQALVNQSYLALPRRTTAGFDSNRLALLTAVMEKILGTALFDKDIFINVVGGLKISEPAADLPLICAVLSSFFDKPLPESIAILGEVGLTGEIRPVSNMELRVKEAQRLGMDWVLVPKLAKIRARDGIRVKSLGHISQLPDILFS